MIRVKFPAARRQRAFRMSLIHTQNAGPLQMHPEEW